MPGIYDTYKSLLTSNSNGINTITSNVLKSQDSFPAFDDFIKAFKKARKETVTITYDEFRSTIAKDRRLKGLPKVSNEQRQRKAQLSEKAAEYIATEAYEAAEPVSEKLSQTLKGDMRSLKAFFGSELNDETVDIITDGTPKQLTELYTKALNNHIKSIDLKALDKPLSDEELIEKWPQIRKNMGAFCLEYENVRKYMALRGAQVPNELQSKLKEINSIVGPFYSYYKNRLEQMSGEYFAYLPDGFEASKFAREDIWDEVFDDPGMSRSTTHTNGNQLQAIAEYALSTPASKLAANADAVYLDDGRKINPADLETIGRTLVSGQQIIVFYDDDDRPFKFSASSGMPPQVATLYFDEDEYSGILEDRKKELKNTADERRRKLKGDPTPDPISVERFNKMLANSDKLLDDTVKRLKEQQYTRQGYDKALYNIVSATDHAMLDCAMDIFDLNVRGYDLRKDLLNLVSEGKSLEEIKTVGDKKFPELKGYIDVLYAAAKYDIDHIQESRAKAREVLEGIKFTELPDETIREILSKTPDYPKRSETEMNKFDAVNKKVLHQMNEIRLAKPTASVRERWAQALLTKPGMSNEDIEKLAENSRTPEGRVEIFKQIVSDIQSFDPSHINDISLEDYADNLQYYEYIRLITFDYSYLNDKDCQIAFNEMFTPKEQQAFRDYIGCISSAFNSLDKKVAAAGSPFSRYIDFEKFTTDSATQFSLDQIKASSGRSNPSHTYMAGVVTFLTMKQTDAQIKKAAEAFRLISPSRSLETFADIENPVIKELVDAFSKEQNVSPELATVKGTLSKLCSALERVGVNGSVTAENSEQFKNAFKEFNEASASYLADAKDIPDGIRVALGASKGAMECYEKGIEPGKTVNDILSDYSWAASMFGKSAPPLENPNHVPFDSSNASNLECADKYKELANKAKNGFDSHLKEISGDSKTPVEMIRYKTGLLNHAIKGMTQGVNMTDYPDLTIICDRIKDMQSYLDIAHPENTEIHPILNKAFFDTSTERGAAKIFTQTIGNIIDKVCYKAELDETGTKIIKTEIDTPKARKYREILQAMRSAFKEMEFSAEHMGLTSDDVADLTESLGIFTSVEEIQTSIQTKVSIDRDPLKNEDDPLHAIYKAADDISKARIDFLAGKEGAKAPDMALLEKYCDALAAHFDKDQCIYMQDSRGFLSFPQETDSIYRGLQLIAKRIPELSEKANAYITKADRNIKQYFEQRLEECYADPDYDIVKLYNLAADAHNNNKEEISYLGKEKHARQTSDEGTIFISDDAMLKLSTVRMFRYNEYLEKKYDTLLQSLGNLTDNTMGRYQLLLKEMIVASTLKNQIPWMREEYNPEDLASRAPGKTAYEMITGVHINDCSKTMDEYLGKIFSQPGVKKLLEAEPKTIIDIIGNGNADALDKLIENAVIGENNLLADTPESTLEIFTDGRRAVNIAGEFGYRTENSQLYKDIQSALTTVNMLRREPGGTEPKNYVELYEACKTYTNMRGPVPSTPAGKERFNAASEMMLDLGLKLMKALPDKKAQIEADLKATAIRSNDFRDKLREKGDKYLKVFVDEAKKTLGNKNVSTTIKSEEARNRLIGKFAKADALSNTEQIRQDKLEPALNKELQALRDANKIEDTALRNFNLAARIASVVYLSELNNSAQKLGADKIKLALNNETVQEKIMKIHDASSELAAALPRDAVDKILSDPNPAKTLMSGVKLYDDLLKSQKEPEKQKTDENPIMGK